MQHVRRDGRRRERGRQGHQRRIAGIGTSVGSGGGATTTGVGQT
ncbi:hypothetical protein [Candidatus Flexifilum breve]